jgi:multidrug efflux system outer membrane protein
MRKLIPLIAMSLFLCGCPPAHQYVRPTSPVPASWPDRSSVQAVAANAAVPATTPWREFFSDPKLQKVIGMALENNRDLRVAALNIEKTQALYRIVRAQLYPTVIVSASGDAYRVPKTATGKSDPELVGSYRVGLGTVAWELDLFGRIRSLKSSALEQFFATEQARSAAQISLVAAVAYSYLAIAADREELRLAQETLNAQQATYELILQTTKFGMASDLELKQAQSQVETARLDIARYSGQIALDQNALDLVVGTSVPPELLPDDLSRVSDFKEITPGLQSDLLLRRPDILAAEHQLKSANADIGAARAAFFPRVSLTAAAGIVSSDLTNLFKPAAGTWEFAPQITLPIFDYGARKANLQVTQVNEEIAVAEYEKAIQSAFRETNDALSERASLADQQQALQSLVDALQETFRLSEARYSAGLDGYLGVLVAQRSVYVAQKQMVGLRLARLSNVITLYKVLGGGA